MVLTDLEIGEEAIIEAFSNPQLEWYMTDMGCPIGSSIQIYHKASMGGPISIKTSTGNLLAIRNKEAKQLTIRIK